MSPDLIDVHPQLHGPWAGGERVHLALEVLPTRVYADPRVGADVGRVALSRGPFVFCLEGVDHPGGLGLAALPRAGALGSDTMTWPELARGLPVVRAEGWQDEPGDRAQYRPVPGPGRPTTLTAVPYFAWDNRAAGEMAVWIREHQE